MAYSDQRLVHAELHHHPKHLSEEEERRAGLIFSTLFFLMILAQCALVYWKKKNYRTYQQVTLVGLWLIPFLFASELHFWKLLFCWVLWTTSSFYIMYKATRKPIPDRTPRLVYSFFFYAFKLCYGAGVVGYSCIMADFFQLGGIFGLQETLAYVGVMLLFFGLYFGILSRDCSEMCTDRMASSMGYGTKKKQDCPQRQYDPTVCLICCDPLNYNWALMNSSIQSQDIGSTVTAERTVSLSCGHSFHDFCIRGWTIVGKKDTCPYCSEKVSIRAMFANPWETQSLLWANLLDGVRYLIVWNPVIVGFTQLFLYEVGMT